VAHGAAEVEAPLATVAALAGQAHGQLPGERLQRLLEVRHLLAAGVHEVDVLGQRLAQRAGHGVDAAVGHEAAADLRLDLLLDVGGADLGLVALEALLEGVSSPPACSRAASIMRSTTPSRSRFRSVRYR
jgi:hypothetical protein